MVFVLSQFRFRISAFISALVNRERVLVAAKFRVSAHLTSRGFLLNCGALVLTGSPAGGHVFQQPVCEAFSPLRGAAS